METKFLFIQKLEQAEKRPGIVRTPMGNHYDIIKDDGKYSLTNKIYERREIFRFDVVDNIHAFMEANKLDQIYVHYVDSIQEGINTVEKL
jgi:hypothetical protein